MESSAPKPPTPPPSYTDFVPSTAAPHNNTSWPPVEVQTVGHSGGYGPTPIVQQQNTLLPYYDPRSMHSVHAADSRALWRFIGAIAWAYGLIFVTIWAGIIDGKMDT